MIGASVLDLRGHISEEPHYRVRVYTAAQWLNSNDRGHWRKYAEPIKLWRHAAGWAARGAKVPPLRRAYILAELRFPDDIRRDTGNWYPTVKACVDGLVDALVLPNDTAEYLLGPDLRMGEIERGGAGSLTLWIWRLLP